MLWIPDSMSVDSGFHIHRFQIPRAKITSIPDYLIRGDELNATSIKSSLFILPVKVFVSD